MRGPKGLRRDAGNMDLELAGATECLCQHRSAAAKISFRPVHQTNPRSQIPDPLAKSGRPHASGEGQHPPAALGAATLVGDDRHGAKRRVLTGGALEGRDDRGGLRGEGAQHC
eukprot:CAMPEP_0183477524 /NCGR_PEP_ID=MMETSP0370-20130417/168353_1 /TAXON_ID=268820 /ORGANISM="Peridinium aciculiferum, Strain PAER-2" /LENGTH=112 /DNA_ID=CAMNT_0025670431 /DNA_START=174 /DNA_END=511 /DNA_ORIENTATION=+